MRSLNNILFFIVSIILFVNPLFKYFENVFGFVRINISALSFVTIAITLFLYFLIFSVRKNRFITAFRFKKPLFIFYGLIVFLLIYVTCVSLINIPLKIDYVGAKNYLLRFSDSILKYWAFAMSGLVVIDLLINKMKAKIIQFYWFVLTITYLYFTLTNNLGFSITLDGNAVYILLADAYMMLSVIVLTFQKNVFRKTLILLVAFLVMFALNSRAALFLFILVYALIYSLNHRKVLFLFLAFMTFIFMYFNVYDLIMENASNRMFRFFITGQDSSLTTRGSIFQDGFKELSYQFNWIIGDFLGDYDKNNDSLGGYIHNYLSFLRQFGIIPFFIFSLLLLFLYAKLSLNYLLNRKNKILEFLFVYTTIFFLQIIVARSFTSAYIWISLTAIPLYFYSSKYVKDDINPNASQK